MLLRMRRELGGREPQLTPQIDNLLIIDRNVDLLTPLLSQLTYEGLIDETFGIQNSKWTFSNPFNTENVQSWSFSSIVLDQTKGYN